VVRPSRLLQQLWILHGSWFRLTRGVGSHQRPRGRRPKQLRRRPPRRPPSKRWQPQRRRRPRRRRRRSPRSSSCGCALWLSLTPPHKGGQRGSYLVGDGSDLCRGSELRPTPEPLCDPPLCDPPPGVVRPPFRYKTYCATALFMPYALDAENRQIQSNQRKPRRTPHRRGQLFPTPYHTLSLALYDRSIMRRHMHTSARSPFHCPSHVRPTTAHDCSA
jgi:hypothetical protein